MGETIAHSLVGAVGGAVGAVGAVDVAQWSKNSNVFEGGDVPGLEHSPRLAGACGLHQPCEQGKFPLTATSPRLGARR